MRKRSANRFRKRLASLTNDHKPQSGALRTVRDLAQRGSFAAALTQINTLAGSFSGEAQFKLLLFAGDIYFKQGKFSQAAQTYATIYQQAVSGGQPSVWLRAGIGRVRSLLKSVQVTQAVTQAQLLMSQVVVSQQQYQQQVTLADAIIQAGGQATIPAQPPAIGGVSARLGRLFFSEGETDTAKQLFQSALQADANHCKARLGLAEITLREGRPADAENLIKETIALNHYGIDTLAAWPLLLAACRQTGNDPLGSNLLDGLVQVAPGLKARALLLVAQGLRRQNDDRWRTIATSWLQASPSDSAPIAAEFNKLIVASDKITVSSGAARQQNVQNLINTPRLGPHEKLHAAKELVRATLANGQDPQIDALLAQMAAGLPANFQPVIIHGLARACRKANRSDLALALFQRNVTSQTPDNKWWGKAVWAMGHIQQEQGAMAAAAGLFWQFYQQPSQPQRLRFYALAQWARILTATGQSNGLATVKSQLAAALPSLTDYELVLDLARQIRISSFDAQLAETAFQQGLQLAMQAFNAAQHPSPAATILFKLARRANDFAHYDAIIATWAGLNNAKKQWIWSTKGDYWSYLELVFRAYRDKGQATKAEQFALPILNDSATPPEGYAILGISYAIFKGNKKDFQTMFAVYQKMIQRAPTYEWTSAAYYWFALRAWTQGSPSQTRAYADQMLLALGHDLGFQWKLNMAAAGWCLKAGLDLSQASLQSGVSIDKLQAQLNIIHKDLVRLTS